MTLMHNGLKRAAVFQYLFLSEILTDIEGEQHQLHRTGSAVLEILRGAVEHWYPWFNLVPKVALPTLWPPRNERMRNGTFYQLGDEHGWRDTLDGKYKVLCYGLWKDEALYLQLGIVRLGAADDDTWEDLHKAVWTPPEEVKNSPFYLGQIVCYGGQCRDLQAARGEARRVLLGSHLREASLIDVGWVFESPALPETLSLFYPDDSAESLADDYFNALLPSLCLYALKVQHSYRRYWWGGFRDRIHGQERDLARVLHASAAQSNTALPATPAEVGGMLRHLQEQAHAVARAFGAFASVLNTFRQLRHSAEINAANVENTFADYSLPATGPFAALRRGIASNISQLQADATFYDVRVSEADIVLRALQGQAEILQARLLAERNTLAEHRNERLKESVEEIEEAHHFLHRIEYFLISVYFAHLFHMLVADHHSWEEWMNTRWPHSYDWCVFSVVILGAAIGFGFASVLDRFRKSH